MKFNPRVPIQKTYTFKGIINTKENNKLVNKIFITPYEVKDCYNEYPCLDYDVDKINPKYCIFNTEFLYNILPKLTKLDTNVLMAIVYNLEPDTNLVKFSSINYATHISKSGNQILQSINNLIHFNILFPVSSQSTYIINHNIFYKGDLNKFAKEYKIIHKDSVIEYDKKGRIII